MGGRRPSLVEQEAPIQNGPKIATVLVSKWAANICKVNTTPFVLNIMLVFRLNC